MERQSKRSLMFSEWRRIGKRRKDWLSYPKFQNNLNWSWDKKNRITFQNLISLIVFIKMRREGKRGRNSYTVLVLSLSAHSNLIQKKPNSSTLKHLHPWRIRLIINRYFRGWQVIEWVQATTEENFIWKIQEAWIMSYLIQIQDNSYLGQGQEEHHAEYVEDPDQSERIHKNTYTAKEYNLEKESNNCKNRMNKISRRSRNRLFHKIKLINWWIKRRHWISPRFLNCWTPTMMDKYLHIASTLLKSRLNYYRC